MSKYNDQADNDWNSFAKASKLDDLQTMILGQIQELRSQVDSRVTENDLHIELNLFKAEMKSKKNSQAPSQYTSITTQPAKRDREYSDKTPDF